VNKRNEKPLKITIPFEDAVKAFLETKPERKKPKPKARGKKREAS